ncbi:MAG: hypothetical protein H6573_05615 [Lewinellaceae bacterium]|nr:hypothetical protein [Lewinellaceae bacterium]
MHRLLLRIKNCDTAKHTALCQSYELINKQLQQLGSGAGIIINDSAKMKTKPALRFDYPEEAEIPSI